MPKLWLPAAKTQASGLIVHGVGFREDMEQLIVDRPHGTAECLVMCFHDPVDLWLDGRHQRIGAGHGMVWTPHRRHFFGRTDRTWSHTWMYAGGPLAAEWIERAPLWLVNRLLPTAVEPVMLHYVKGIYEEFLAQSPPDPFVYERLFELLIREIARVARPTTTAAGGLGGASQPVPAVYQQVRQFIEANLHRRLALADLAAVAHLSISRFSGEFHRWFGLAPMQYLHRQRMRRAALMLLDNHRRVSDVAFALGFDDPLYFSRQFTKLIGENPTAYRRRLAVAAPDEPAATPS